MNHSAPDRTATAAGYGDSLDYVTIRIGGQLLGLPIASVQPGVASSGHPA